MWFWMFMLMTDLLIPLTMIGFGRYFMKTAPKKINGSFGYRTGMSMKNRDTWEFAHKCCGRIWFVCGLVMLPLSAAAMLFALGKETDVVGTLGGIVCFVQMIPLTASIFAVEGALKKNFDRDGRKGNAEQYQTWPV